VIALVPVVCHAAECYPYTEIFIATGDTSDLWQKRFEARWHVGVAGVGSTTFPHSLSCNLASGLAKTMGAKSRVVRDVLVISNSLWTSHGFTHYSHDQSKPP